MKKEEARIDKSQLEAFRCALEENQLHHLGWKCGMFTWSNKQAYDSFIKKILDRQVGNLSWK